ncbi:Brp/Blh family beta-carotene 15,15'-dioxygenase [Halopiger xanaduensis]|uniref:Probable beta-carotene 15,15'-dioxygenase n=1 Tax=Halopiger xanaduensis (strain DSM 18323 / JCM 14033 / SH-6) TaxID=797210 RepID=F8D7E3_HALXS|nr:Brp/Blh family beta-carotene 15,15'-dioxygenase [Halopiger xanaduensis]AEH37863.1 beta-carotene 15,15'-monooxygenase, Brp/Blh family [Halopiger xanaduensis SH-6]
MLPDAANRATPETGAATARRRAAYASHAAGLFTIIFGLTIGVTGDSIPLAYQYAPLAASVVVLGLPHGAVDHLVLPRSRGRPVTSRALAAVGGCYLAIGGAYAALWFVAPAVSFALFILLTLVHWGQGDVYALCELTDVSYLETPAHKGLALVVRGGLPMLVPLVAFPDQYAFVAGTLVGLFDPGAAAALEGAFRPTVRYAVAVGFGALIAATLALGYRRTDALEPWLIDAGETLGLTAFFAAVPPILAIGLYFTGWHSVRHIVRTLLIDDAAVAALADGDARGAIGRFARDAAPLTAGSLVVFAALAVAVPRTPATVPDAAALYLVGVAVLTLPHVVVVSLLDLEQGLWTAR